MRFITDHGIIKATVQKRLTERYVNTNIRNTTGGSMRATILTYAIILTKANRAAVSMMAKGSIVA